jgi:hypothetical protein
MFTGSNKHTIKNKKWVSPTKSFAQNTVAKKDTQMSKPSNVIMLENVDAYYCISI